MQSGEELPLQCAKCAVTAVDDPFHAERIVVESMSVLYV